MSMINSARKLTALSLFSGAGGMDLGLSQEGFRILASIEIDPHCCETLRARRDATEAVVIQEDIRRIDPSALMQELDFAPGQLDLLAGGPPCQAFSQIGKRQSLLDQRGLLLFEVIRFAQVLRPRAILVEQVKGLLNAPDVSGRPGGVLDLFLNELKTLGYVPKWQVINSAEYGVPQVRHRVFIVATPPPNGFSFPGPTHSKPGLNSLFRKPAYATVGEALEGLPEPLRGNERHLDPPCANHIDVTPAGDRIRIEGVPEGGHLAAQRHLPSEIRRSLTKKDTTKFRRLSRFEPSLTLRCGEIFFHPTARRYLTPREYMRLHGFPDDYELKGPIRGRSGRVRHLDQHRQVANSVPPPVARALAREISLALEHRMSKESAEKLAAYA